MTESESVSINMSVEVDREVWSVFGAFAQAFGLSKKELLARAIREYVDNHMTDLLAAIRVTQGADQ